MGLTLIYFVEVDQKLEVLGSGLLLDNHSLQVLKTLPVVGGRKLSQELRFFLRWYLLYHSLNV
jgi:hypothetical protein